MNEKYLGKFRSKTLRAEWHEYNGGEYFIMICTKNRIAEYIENNVANWQK